MLNVEAGLRVNLTERLYAFGEWRYDTAELHISNFRSESNIKAAFGSNAMLFGIGLSFDKLSDLNPMNRLRNWTGTTPASSGATE
jgi:hypothetical protein